MTSPNPLKLPEFEKLARNILEQETRALASLKARLNIQHLYQAYGLIHSCQGIILVLGSGTSSSVARRLAHVLTCSGVRAIYLDAGQAQHGYSAFIRQADLLIAFSRGGETDEINHVLQIARDKGAQIISIVENAGSTMAHLSDVVLLATLDPEDDAVGVIPLASTLVHAALGDILCATILVQHGYDDVRFAEYHPGGAVGKRLRTLRNDEASDTASSIKPSKSSKEPASIRGLEADMQALCTLRGLILDMDGVLWRGSQPLPGLIDFFQVLKRHSFRYVLATNNPSQRPENFAAKAREFGIDVQDEDVITSGTATIAYLRRHYPAGTRVHVIGQKSLKEQIVEAGYTLADKDVVAVIAALDRELTYETIKRGTLLIRAGAVLIGTNPDNSYPTEEGIVPGSGMMVTALAASSDATPLIMGKPKGEMFDLALERLKLPPEKVASVGDRLDSDILGGYQAGLRTILLLTGIAQREDVVSSPIRPDWIFPGLPELTRALLECEQRE